MDVYAMASPGVRGALIASDVPCRVVHARSIIDQFWPGVVNWFYITTASEIPQAPAYAVVGGSFHQDVDFTLASWVEISDGSAPLVLTHKQIFAFAGGETYYRFDAAEASSFLAPPCDDRESCPCAGPMAEYPDLEDYSFMGGLELWFAWDYDNPYIGVYWDGFQPGDTLLTITCYSGTCDDLGILSETSTTTLFPIVLDVPEGTSLVKALITGTGTGLRTAYIYRYTP